MNIYVGNLPYQTAEAQLSALFAQYGEVVNATIISDKFTGKSRGFGFVEMAQDEQGKKAIESLNGQEFSGRALVVNEARQREEGARRTGGFQRRRND